MGLKVTHSGVLDTIQDMGRFHYQHLGINPGGFMDPCAASIANFLVGNSSQHAALELHFPASEFIVEKPCLLALSGADFRATINGSPFPINQTLVAGKGCIIKFHKSGNMTRTYLAIHGGIKGESWLGSSGTNLKIKKGGIQGRGLKKGDRLTPEREYLKYQVPPENTFALTGIKVYTFSFYKNPDKLRFIPSMDSDGLDDSSVVKMINSEYHVDRSSDRMGYRLTGPKLLIKKNFRQKFSSAVVKGTLQLLPSGDIVILMADHQSTGGYPMIGNIIASDLPKLAQKKPGDPVYFNPQNLHLAENEFIRYLKNMNQIQDYCMKQLKHRFYENH